MDKKKEKEVRKIFSNYFNLRTIILLTMLLLVGFVVQKFFLALFVVGVLYAVDIVFSTILRFTLRPVYNTFPVGIELVTFNTVIAALAFGPIVGVICGLLFSLTYYGLIFNFNSSYQIITIPAYGLLGFMAGILPIENILVLGMLLAAAYGIITSFLIIVLFAGRPLKCFIFVATNLLFNYWVFSNFGPIVLNIIG